MRRPRSVGPKASGPRAPSMAVTLPTLMLVGVTPWSLAVLWVAAAPPGTVAWPGAAPAARLAAPAPDGVAPWAPPAPGVTPAGPPWAPGATAASAPGPAAWGPVPPCPPVAAFTKALLCRRVPHALIVRHRATANASGAEGRPALALVLVLTLLLPRMVVTGAYPEPRVGRARPRVRSPRHRILHPSKTAGRPPERGEVSRR